MNEEPIKLLRKIADEMEESAISLEIDPGIMERLKKHMSKEGYIQLDNLYWHEPYSLLWEGKVPPFKMSSKGEEDEESEEDSWQEDRILNTWEELWAEVWDQAKTLRWPSQEAVMNQIEKMHGLIEDV